MSKKIWIGVIIAMILLLVGAFIWNQHRYAPKKEIVIGCIFDLTGSLSYMGQWSLEGAKLAEEEVNSSGGINGRVLKLLVDDSETNPQKAATIFQRMIAINKLPVVIGFNGSSEVMAAAPIANRSRVVLFSTGGASPHITKAGDFVFRNRLSGAIEASGMAEIAYNKLQMRRGIILYINTDYGKSYSEAFRSRFTGLGGEIKAIEGFMQDETDFRAQLTKIQSFGKIDFVYLASHVREAASILKQAKEMGISTRWLASNAIEGPELFKIAGNAAEGIIYTVERYNPDDPSARKFNSKYSNKYGRDSEMFAAHAYDAVKILTKIISEVGYDGNSIKEALYNLREYPGVSGKTSFDENGDVIKAIVVKMVINGTFQEATENDLKADK